MKLRNLESYNDGYSYLLIIDVLNKYVWIEPLRDKTSNCMIKALQRVLAKSEGQVLVYLQTDKGKEFVAQKSMQKFFKENDIHFRVTRNPETAIIERINRTLKQMWRYFTQKKSTQCHIEVLQDIVRAYNHSTRM